MNKQVLADPNRVFFLRDPNTLDDEENKEQGKKYSDYEVYRPYHGATTFNELETAQDAMDYSYKVSNITDQLHALIYNITCDDEMSADEKASSIASCANEYKTRINDLSSKELKALKVKNKGNEGVFTRILNAFKILGIDDEEAENNALEPQDLAEVIKELTETNSSFKVFKDRNTGEPRWATLSSNAFEDLDHELFSTKALEDAVEHADKTGERGPLLVYHVPSAEIGQCDFQAVVGRFLLESGTFDDTPLGRKALEYYVTSQKEHQVSIGFRYQPGDEDDGVYDWLRIRERSVCPAGAAANPWTDFRVMGGTEVALTESKIANIREVFGDDMGNDIISKVDAKSKELEDKGVRFKEKEEDAKDSDGEVKEEPETPAKTEEVAGMSNEQVGKLGEMIATLVSEVQELSSIKETVISLQAQIKELKMSDDEKIAAALTPKGVDNATRPSESAENVVDGKVKAVSDNDPPKNPIMPYIEDMIGASRVGKT